jgi:hypothetical protein
MLLNRGGSRIEFLLGNRYKLIGLIVVNARTSASSKLRWIFGMRCSSLCTSVAFPVTSCQEFNVRGVDSAVDDELPA